MKEINCKQILKGLNGKSLTAGGGADAELLTLGVAIANVLLTPRKIAGENKIRMYVLSTKLYEAKGKIELDVADEAFIKDACLADEAYGPLVTGQILKILT